jgi:hypothetical protein
MAIHAGEKDSFNPSSFSSASTAFSGCAVIW